MTVWHLTLILSIFITSHSWGSVKAYFNHNPRTSYSEPYRNVTRQGDNLEKVILDQIQTARKSIFIAVQELRLPLVAKALILKKAQGVDVRVILEHDYNFTIMEGRQAAEDQHEATKFTELQALVDVNRDGKASKEELESRDAVYMLRAAKIPVIDDTSDSSVGSGLMHHKFIIVDGLSTVISSANFTLSCIHGDILAPGSRGNPNSMVVVGSAAVADIFGEEFLQMWGNGNNGTFGQNKTHRGARTVNVGGVKVTIQFSPTSARLDWTSSVNGLIALVINQAKQSVNAALFVYSDQLISNVIETKNNAGVKVGVLVENKFAFREYSELLDMAGFGIPNQACEYEQGNRPWAKPGKEFGIPSLANGDVLHHKFAVVDNKIVVVGSQNWSDAANFTNDETAIVIQDPRISDQFTQEYYRLKALTRVGVPNHVIVEARKAQARCAGRAH